MIPQLPKRIMSVLARTYLRGPLTKTYIFNRAGEHETVFTFGDGRVAPNISVDEAIVRGLIVPVGDGLLPEDSQTWALSDPVKDFFGQPIDHAGRRG